jgi:hypothetical protein
VLGLGVRLGLDRLRLGVIFRAIARTMFRVRDKVMVGIGLMLRIGLGLV